MKISFFACQSRLSAIVFSAVGLLLSGCAEFSSAYLADSPPVLISADTQIRDMNAPAPRPPAPKVAPKPVVKKPVPRPVIKPKPAVKKPAPVTHTAIKSGGGFQPCPPGALAKLQTLGAVYAYYVKNGACASGENRFPSLLAQNWSKQTVRLLNGDPGFSAFISAGVRDSLDQTGKTELTQALEERGCGLVKDVYCKVIMQNVKKP